MHSNSPGLTPEYSRLRQARVQSLLVENSLQRAIFTTREHIQYLTGYRPHRFHEAVLCLDVEQGAILVAPNEIPQEAAIDDCLTFEAQRHCTLRQDQLQAALKVLFTEIGSSSAMRVGIEGSACHFHLLESGDLSRQLCVDLEPDLWRLRRRKDPDERQLIRKAIDCTAAMYEHARKIIQPGISELEVYNELQAVAVEIAGEPLLALGNDFQCGSPGGPPRSRIAQAGELYILDLGPCYRGYYADNCRTIAIDGSPTKSQTDAWQRIVEVLTMVEEAVRPGVSCRKLFEQARKMLDDLLPGAFFHHLGHGFGLDPHEAPHLNPDWDDLFEVGDYFTAEPGLYSAELKAGLRLEQDYLVTEKGVERLTNFELGL